MKKYSLFKKASAIHAIKCNLSEELQFAEESFDTFCNIKKNIFSTSTDNFDEIEIEINAWAKKYPEATPEEIEFILNRKK